MANGIFGKLPARRDFVARSIPQVFLDIFEPWLQRSFAVSREALGSAWQARYLSAPIWRFWLGREICGTGVLGAIMPSVDGVGRYFPLVVAAVADGGQVFPLKEHRLWGAWFEPAEQVLLSALDDGTSYETVVSALDRLVAPPESPVPARNADGPIVIQGSPDNLDALVSGASGEAVERWQAHSSLWWTVGGTEFAPAAVACEDLPPAWFFSAMLTGEFSGRR